MGVTLEKPKKKNSSDIWVARKGKHWKACYSITRYGKYAEQLAELSFKTGERYKNIYIEHDSYYTIKILSNKYGEHDVLFDKEDYENVSKYAWSLLHTSSGIYIDTSIADDIKGRYHVQLHRLVMCASPTDIVDHRNRDRFDNRKSNLRITTSSINNRNQSVRKTSKTGFTGVTIEYNSYAVRIRDFDGILHRKWFNINKLGQEEALKKAVKWRYKRAKEYGYRTDLYSDFLGIKIIKIKKKIIIENK